MITHSVIVLHHLEIRPFMGSESPPSGGNDAYYIAGREVPQDKSKAKEMFLVTQWVSVFSLEEQIVVLHKSQRT